MKCINTRVLRSGDRMLCVIGVDTEIKRVQLVIPSLNGGKIRVEGILLVSAGLGKTFFEGPVEDFYTSAAVINVAEPIIVSEEKVQA